MNAPRRRWLIVLALFVLANAAVGIALGVTLWRMQHPAAQQAEPEAVKTMSEDEVEQWRAMSLGEAHRLVTLYSEPQTADGRVQIMLSNAEENQYAVRMELVRLDTQEVIASTDLLDPGWRLESVKLLMELEKGTHFCLARLFFYEPDGVTMLGETARQVLIRID